jgi:hypothetical protein
MFVLTGPLSFDFSFGMTGRRSEKPLKSILSKRPREAARAAKRPREAPGRHQKARKAPAPRVAAQTDSRSPSAVKGGAPVSPWGVTVGRKEYCGKTTRIEWHRQGLSVLFSPHGVVAPQTNRCSWSLHTASMMSKSFYISPVILTTVLLNHRRSKECQGMRKPVVHESSVTIVL